MLYIRNGMVAADPWLRIADGAPLPNDGAVIVSGARLLAADDPALSERNAPLGVLWPNHEPVAVLAPHLSQVSLVALVFPTFRDGRAYTQARQLREQLGFKGELRATGDVLRDQFQFMTRAGFDAFEVKKDVDAQAFAHASHEFTVLYQPPERGAVSIFEARRNHRSKEVSHV